MEQILSDSAITELAAGAVSRLVISSALARMRVLRAAALLLLAGHVALLLAEDGVPGLVAAARAMAAYVLGHAEFFKGTGLGALGATLLTIRRRGHRFR